MVEFLIKRKAQVNFWVGCEIKVTPLFLACTRGDLEMVKLLIEVGADVLYTVKDTPAMALFVADEKVIGRS